MCAVTICRARSSELTTDRAELENPSRVTNWGSFCEDSNGVERAEPSQNSRYVPILSHSIMTWVSLVDTVPKSPFNIFVASAFLPDTASPATLPAA